MAPFRTRDQDHAIAPPPAAVHDAVSQMVRQFADPMAFCRELVQNSLDAGATGIDVSLAFVHAAGDEPGTLRVSVTDDGCGMDQATLERTLLVLFRSSKDGDPTKIGKFGVGFFSVFALAPREVVVDTGTGPNGFRLRLSPDFTYELRAISPRRGTTVTLHVPCTLAAAREYVASVLEALSRWCPHVAVPLRFASLGVFGAEHEARIDRPFGVEGVVSVVANADNGAVDAVALGEDTRGAFYNRGILLHAVSEWEKLPVRFATNDPQLSHTISRDDVRRDASLDRAVTRLAKLAKGPLREAFVRAFNAASDVSGRAGQSLPSVAREEAARLARLADPRFVGALGVNPSELRWPLTDEVVWEGRRVRSFAHGTSLLRDHPRLFAEAPNALTAMVSAQGTPVVDMRCLPAGPREGALHGLFTWCYEGAAHVDTRYTHVARVDTAGEGEAAALLFAHLASLLARAGIDLVYPVEALGAGREQLLFALARDALPAPGSAVLLVADDTDEDPFGLLSTRALGVNAAHPRVAAARRAAARDPQLAALILARLVLLALGRLDATRDDALLSAVAKERGAP